MYWAGGVLRVKRPNTMSLAAGSSVRKYASIDCPASPSTEGLLLRIIPSASPSWQKASERGLGNYLVCGDVWRNGVSWDIALLQARH